MNEQELESFKRYKDLIDAKNASMAPAAVEEARDAVLGAEELARASKEASTFSNKIPGLEKFKGILSPENKSIVDMLPSGGAPIKSAEEAAQLLSAEAPALTVAEQIAKSNKIGAIPKSALEAASTFIPASKELGLAGSAASKLDYVPLKALGSVGKAAGKVAGAAAVPLSMLDAYATFKDVEAKKKFTLKDALKQAGNAATVASVPAAMTGIGAPMAPFLAGGGVAASLAGHYLPEDYNYTFDDWNSPTKSPKEEQLTKKTYSESPAPLATDRTTDDEFIDQMSQLESSRGKNVIHKLMTEGPHAGDRAIGLYGLMPNTVKESLKRDLEEGKEIPSELKNFKTMSNQEIYDLMQNNTELQAKIARNFAHRLLDKTGGDLVKANYMWETGHNRNPDEITQEKLLNSDRVKRYAALTGNDVNRTLASTSETPESPKQELSPDLAAALKNMVGQVPAKENELERLSKTADATNLMTNILKSGELLGGGIGGAMSKTAPNKPMATDILNGIAANADKGVENYAKKLEASSLAERSDPNSSISKMARSTVEGFMNRIGIPYTPNPNLSAHSIEKSGVLEKYGAALGHFEEAKAKSIEAKIRQTEMSRHKDHLEGTRVLNQVDNDLKSNRDLSDKATKAQRMLAGENLSPQEASDAQAAIAAVITGRIAVPESSRKELKVDTIRQQASRIMQYFGRMGDLRKDDPILYAQLGKMVDRVAENQKITEANREQKMVLNKIPLAKDNSYIQDSFNDRSVKNAEILFSPKQKEAFDRLKEKHPEAQAYELYDAIVKGVK